MGENPENESIDQTMKNNNKGQTSCFVENKTYEKSYKAYIEHLLEGAIS